ncbi:hypothetical protein AMS68_006613 [Peltaster fructicola]|uniref:Pentacotripeptide-repeat region of PRORP domain-containing protein n=1 Tax=Peltaster fructicola TaxID=286661 RepID=A0A6H0Y2D1_9PEZI|nr:hypothetical protein AMS68_006613 [Peltaster fructicola]
MLERASTCLENGARLSLRSARRPGTSKRQLQAAFFTHGALDLNLSSLAIDAIHWKHDDSTSGIHRKSCEKPDNVEAGRISGHKDGKSKAASGDGNNIEPYDPGFLDFLYPRQALAWLAQRSPSFRDDSWKTRNASRLPRGYVHALREYSSIAHHDHTQNSKGSHASPAFLVDDEFAVGDWREPDNTHSINNTHAAQQTLQWAATSEELYANQRQANTVPTDFVSRTLAQLRKKRLSRVDMTLHFIEKAQERLAFIDNAPVRLAGTNSQIGSQCALAVVNLYNQLTAQERARPALVEPILQFLAKYHSESSDNDLIGIYNRLSKTKRTLPTYYAVISVFLRCGLVGLANQAQQEASELLSRKGQAALSIWYIANALVNEQWDPAYQRYMNAFNGQTNILPQVWSTLDSLDDSLPRAARLADEMYCQKTVHREDKHRWGLYLGFVKAAMLRDLRRNTLKRTMKDRFRAGIHCKIIQSVCQNESTADCIAVFEDVLEDITKACSVIDFNSVGKVTTQLVQACLLKTEDVASDTKSRLLWQYVCKVLDNTNGQEHIAKRWHHMRNLSDLVRFRFGALGVVKPAPEKAALFMERYARTGDCAGVNIWAEVMRSWAKDRVTDVPQSSLVSLIDVHAARRDYREAARAYGELRAEAQRLTGTEPGTTYLNACLRAFINAGQLRLADKLLERHLEHGGKFDAGTFEPLLHHLAMQGRTSSLEALLLDYERYTESKPTVALLTYLVKAHVVNHDFDRARKTFANRIFPLADLEDHKALTEPFNLILMESARHVGITTTQALWQGMQDAEVEIDAHTYAALAQAHATNRNPAAAMRIVRNVMPERNIRATALHYGIVMQGFLNTDEPQRAIGIYMSLHAQTIKSSPLMEKLYLIAVERAQNKQGDYKGVDPALLTARLDVMFEELPWEPLHTRQYDRHMEFPSPNDRTGGGSLGDTIGAILAMLGRGGHIKEIEQFMEKYNRWLKSQSYGELEIAEHFPATHDRYKSSDVDNATPLGKRLSYEVYSQHIEISTGLMLAYLTNDQHNKVNEIWWNILQTHPDRQLQHYILGRSRTDWKPRWSVANYQVYKSKVFSTNVRRADEASSEVSNEEYPSPFLVDNLKWEDKKVRKPPSTSLGDRLLSAAFSLQITSLARQDKRATLTNLVRKYISYGLTMDRATVNNVVQQCLTVHHPLVLLAFQLTEQYMIEEFPGWQTDEGTSKSNSRLLDGSFLMRQDSIATIQARPDYMTLVLLCNAALKLSLLGSRGEMGIFHGWDGRHAWIGGATKIIRDAPNTLLALSQMPKVPGDYLQETYIESFKDEYPMSRPALTTAKEAAAQRWRRQRVRKVIRGRRRQQRALGDQHHLLLPESIPTKNREAHP